MGIEAKAGGGEDDTRRPTRGGKKVDSGAETKKGGVKLLQWGEWGLGSKTKRSHHKKEIRTSVVGLTHWGGRLSTNTHKTWYWGGADGRSAEERASVGGAERRWAVRKLLGRKVEAGMDRMLIATSLYGQKEGGVH